MVCGIPAKMFKHELLTLKQILNGGLLKKQWSGFFKKSMSETRRKRESRRTVLDERALETGQLNTIYDP